MKNRKESTNINANLKIIRANVKKCVKKRKNYDVKLLKTLRLRRKQCVTQKFGILRLKKCGNKLVKPCTAPIPKKIC